MSANKADIRAILGSSGSGKSTLAKRMSAKATRLIVWDPLREYGDHGTVYAPDQLGALAASLVRVNGGRIRAVYQPPRDPKQMAARFAQLCKLAWHAGRLMFIVEELRFVTRPSFAPMEWSEVTLTGRHQGLTVIGTSQRPVHIDKDFLGNATEIYCGTLGYRNDIQAAADALMIDAGQIGALPPLEFLHLTKSPRKTKKISITF